MAEKFEGIIKVEEDYASDIKMIDAKLQILAESLGALHAKADVFTKKKQPLKRIWIFRHTKVPQGGELQTGRSIMSEDVLFQKFDRIVRQGYRNSKLSEWFCRASKQRIPDNEVLVWTPILKSWIEG